MSSEHSMRIGIDLGGSKTEGILLGGNGEILIRKRVATPSGDYRGIVAAVTALVEELEADVDDKLPVGIGTPGAISLKTGRMKNCNATCLNDMPLKEDLDRSLERPVRIANDADCMTLSEASDGAAADFENVFGVILGTGVGGGVCIHGSLVSGINAIAGEWGHTTLPLSAYQCDQSQDLQAPKPALRSCFCGRYDCVETYLSGPGLQRTYLETSGSELRVEQIVELASTDDAVAVAVLEQYSNLLALALSSVINILDPAAIVLAGGLSNMQSLYNKVPEYWSSYVFSDQISTRLLQSKHGDSSGVRGAAWLWPKT
ncbi:MAG: ROK family protein [Pseudomonadales bacterium]|jgi:predicted NBD/HSP70 family sugar kinase|nr:ROK family protein [Pseudomonadales bacterium]MDP7144089.1 ROK family protein [Pseudomonadales bacterium]MDP7359344.1 ROK family protein [Pseudomonadales bacterium]MDP7594684.1 ROK family protein [Pseudomonadales bacterium]HJN50376.1 ROK family protein [Pseudomonadales bacterium]|tara:strand:+ start:10587 stop:11534 length:948 start_codon:yes stop_codon:yes gene_type:complete